MTVTHANHFNKMSPTAEHPITYSIRSDCSTSSSSPGREITAARHAFFPSLYTHGGIVPPTIGKASSSSSTRLVRTSGDTYAPWRGKDEPPPSTRRNPPPQAHQSIGIVLPTIDTNVGLKRPQYLAVASSSDDLATSQTTSSPSKQWRMSALNDIHADATRLPVSSKRDSNAFSGSPQQHSDNRRRVVRNQQQTTFVKATSAIPKCVEISKIDYSFASPRDYETWDTSVPKTSLSPPEIISTTTTPVPRSILVLNRFHDCATENIRTFINGLDLDAPSHRRPISLPRCSRLLPSEAATTVLLGLIDEDAVERLTKARSLGSVFEDRKSVRFEPTVRVFCEDMTCGQVMQKLRPLSGHQVVSPRNAGSLLPPLTSKSSENTNSGIGEELPAVVQRYMVRSDAPQS